MVSFIDFCENYGLTLFPPQPKNVARYLTVCADKPMVYATINNKLSAIGKFYRLCGHKLDTSHPDLDIFMQACKKQLSSTSKPKAPIEPGHLILIQAICDISIPDNRLFFVALIMQFFTCVRKSNLLPPSLNTFSTLKHFTRGDFHFTPGGITVTLPWTKTLQSRDDVITILVADCPDAVLNPVAIYRDFITDFPLYPPTLPAFALNDGSKLLVLTQKSYIDSLKTHVSALGLPPEAYSSHSVRRGSTTCMFQASVPNKLIKHHGTWKTNCYERYIQPSYSDKLIPTKKMVSHINSIFGAN